MSRIVDGSGAPLQPLDGVVPVLRELRPGVVKVVGTAFWITRYGLLMTAGHVADDLVQQGQLCLAFVPQFQGQDEVILRRLLNISRMNEVDIAVLQAENFGSSAPRPIANKRAPLSAEVPAVGSPMSCYGYPLNEILTLSEGTLSTIRGDFYEGQMLGTGAQGEHPFLPYPHIVTSIDLKSGASGAPAFDEAGRVVGICSRGWELLDGPPLSYVVPVSLALRMQVHGAQIPESSWEFSQLPHSRRKKDWLWMFELVQYGHVEFVPAPTLPEER